MKKFKKLSNTEMKNVTGGYSKLYCAYHSFNIVVFDIVIKDGIDYDTCRKMHD